MSRKKSTDIISKIVLMKFDRFVYYFTIFLQSQEAIIRNGIMNEEGPLKKENALNSLFSALENYHRQNTRKAV